MNEKKFNEIIKLIEEEINKILLAGLKGKFQWPWSNFVEQRSFRNIMNGEMKIEERIKQLKEHISQHEVLKAETDEATVILKIVQDLGLLYHSVFSIFQNNNTELKHIKENIEAEVRFISNKRLSEEDIKRLKKVFLGMIEEWEKDMKQVREEVNATWSRAQGGSGWALTMFETMHNQGFFTRFQERRKFREAVKSFSVVEHDMEALSKIKNKKDLEKYLAEIPKRHEIAVSDYEDVEKLLFSTWDAVNKQLEELITTVYKGTAGHELPKLDAEQMNTLKFMVVGKLEHKFLSNLRIDIKQLESEIGEVKEAVSMLKAS